LEHKIGGMKSQGRGDLPLSYFFSIFDELCGFLVFEFFLQKSN